jgi:hypothetical protein
MAIRGLGCPVRFTLTAAQKGDAPQAAELIEGLPAEVVIGDTAYEADHLRQATAAEGAIAVTSTNLSRALKYPLDKHLYAQDGQTMGVEVRAVIRQGTSPPTSSADLALASGRDGSPDRLQAILALAGGRSALSEAKHFRIGGRRLRPEQQPSPSTLVRPEPSLRDNPALTADRSGRLVLLYRDESGALTHPCLARAWAKSGTD